MSKIISEIPNSIPKEFIERLAPFCRSMRGKKLYDGYYLSTSHTQAIVYRVLYTKKNKKPDCYTIINYSEIPDGVSHKMRPLTQWSTFYPNIEIFNSIDELESVAMKNYNEEMSELKSIYSNLFKFAFKKELS